MSEEERKYIIGAKKGGGGKPYVPVESPDSISSDSIVDVLDVLSEGPIQGLEIQADGGSAGSIFMDKTALTNFEGYKFEARTGTQTQTYISRSNGTKATTSVAAGLTVAGGALTRTITDSNVDKVAITVEVPVLHVISDRGDVYGHSVQFKISVDYNGGGFADVQTVTIRGKSSDKFQKTYEIDLTGAFPVSIRLTRISADETSAKRQNLTNWYSYTTIIEEKFTYPNSAITWLELNAKNFSSVPLRRYLIRGIKVKIPHNASVDTTTHLGRVTYSGTFNGTLNPATWCSDPAWILFDLLTNSRYGCGLATSELDVFDFYRISQYCNELVTIKRRSGDVIINLADTQEVRFSCNCVLNTRKEAYTVIQELTNVFRGMAFYGCGSMGLTQDKPTDSQYLFSPTNVIDGLFTYSGSSHKTRHTVVNVSWQDYELKGETQVERVEDIDAIGKYGIIQKEIKGFACWSQGQAQRLGRWLLLSEKMLTQTCSFGISVQAGIILFPGMIISIADPLKSGNRFGGRIKSVSEDGTDITVDTIEDMSWSTSQSPKMSVVLPTGLVEQKAITAVASGGVYTIASAFSVTPNVGEVYQIETSAAPPKEYRVLSVTEEDEKSLAVTALEYDESIYALIEDTNVSIGPTPIPLAPHAITEADIEVYFFGIMGSHNLAADVTWVHDGINTVNYQYKFQFDDNNWQEPFVTEKTFVHRNIIAPSTLKVQITPMGFFGLTGPTFTKTFSISQPSNAPGDVQNLTITQISDNEGRLEWSPTVDYDVELGGEVHIRHSSDTSGNATFDGSADLIAPREGWEVNANVPYLDGEYMVKFKNIWGVKSANEASVIVSSSIPTNWHLIYNRREDTDNPVFQGTKTNVSYYSPPNFATPITGLVIDGDTAFDSVADVDALVSFDFCNNVRSSGEYVFNDVLDLEGVYYVNAERHLVAEGFHYGTGAPSSNANATLYVRTTNDDPSSGGATWSSYIPLNKSAFTARGFQFKIVLTSSDGIANVVVSQLGCKFYMAIETETSFTSYQSGTSQKAVTFTVPFFAGVSDTIGGANGLKPSVNVNVYNLESGDFHQVSSITGTGYNIDVKNSSGSHVDRTFNYMATGLR